LLERALAQYRQCADAYGQVDVLYKLAGWHAAQGEVDQARDTGKEGYALAEQHGFVRWEIYLLWLLGDLDLQQGDPRGVNVLAYAVVRAVQLGDTERIERALEHVQRIIQAARAADDDETAHSVREQVLEVWRDRDWVEVMADQISRFED
jgi:hypothetical protein